ncbi:MAG: phage portal protein, partial [Gemmatimonadales bacterium]|nr:phage portal protein [Gemmatimonadales bacterium]
MGFFSSLLPRASWQPNWSPWDDRWYGGGGGINGAVTSAAGVGVSPELALNCSAVFACVRVLAETFAQVPLVIYERMPDGGKRRATEHPLYSVLHDTPNAWQTSFEFRETLVVHLALRGNAYAQIVPGPRGFADQLVPQHPDRVTVNQLGDGKLLYKVTGRDGVSRPVPQDEMIHVRGLSTRGVLGLSVVSCAAQSIGISLAGDRQAAATFANGARPGLVLKHKGTLTPEGRKNLEESWKANYSGDKAGGVAVLEEGVEPEQISLTWKDAQFLESRQFQIGEIARWFRMPPHMIGDLARATFSNIEQQSLEFVTYTMLPYFVRAEQAFTRDLILDPERYFISFVVDGLLRGDSLARAQGYQLGIQSGWMTRNEARRLENLDALPGLDEPLEPLNMAPAG